MNHVIGNGPVTFGFVLMLVIATSVAGQEAKTTGKPMPPQASASGGVAIAGVFAPLRDAKSRIITAGGFVEGAPVVFEDVTRQAGLEKFHHRSGNPDSKFILEALGSGIAVIDYDNDGWPDLYFLNGSTFEAMHGKGSPPRAMLFHNNHDGTFTDVTERAGVANERWGFGVAVGDFDNDGWPDIYVTNFGKNRLYHNNHDGTFTDVAERVGVTAGGWSTGATWGDYDGDGRLDLFVAGYVSLDIERLPLPGAFDSKFCQYRGQPVMCGPRGLPGEQDHLFHNNGDGTFTDVSVKAGVSDPAGYYGLGAAFADIDNDGRLDLIVANDSTARYLYRNRGDGTFEDISYPSGFALNENGLEQASMGLAVGDLRNDGWLDLYVTNFSDDYNTLYENRNGETLTDVTSKAGIAVPTIPFLGWGTAFLDYDNDGWQDIFVANGHVYKEVDQFDWGTTWKQRPLLFRNLADGRFEEVPAATGSGLADLLAARGAAIGDLFNDGHVDVVINNLDSSPTLLRNIDHNNNNWLGIRLIGGSKSPRDAIGAKVYVTSGGSRQRQDVISGGSYCSSSDLRLHFGLGGAKRIEKLEIQWPDGAKETVAVPGINRVLMITEGKGVTQQPAGDHLER